MIAFLWNSLLNLYAFFGLLPFLTFVLVWLITKWKTNNKRKSTLIACDVTTVFLIGTVSAQFDLLFPGAFGGFWLVLLFFLIGAGLLGGAQSRLKGQVNLKKLLRIVWRVGFIVLSAVYLLFALILVIKGLF